ncbi:MAG: tetratricopeptide repeat protein, partial [Chthoniobacterales bacterium]|nr:tetratricopeptide repeat protein [Chthoniobacterales bacterium]
KEYDKAETALRKALAADPKFWNARFNLAEIPFLQKKWPEARKRFQELLTGNASELQGEATQLIQYKIFLTYLLEGKESMATSLMAKFELAPDAPAVHFANAAVALNKSDENDAKEWLTKAEKNFSPQLNKLFAESLYEVGWLEKPPGETRAALELNSAADRAAQTKAFADAKYDQAEQALAQRDFTAARKLVDDADSADPNQPRIVNLRGEILMQQQDFDAAEAEFRKATKIDPKFRDAQFNLAQVPFKKKDYAKARDRFESLFSVTSGADGDQAAQLIKFKIFLTLLLEGKDARARKMMEQFQFTADTPALYYAQAAMEFQGKNPAKATEWVTSARKIYSPALNGVFAESLYDVGWLQSASVAAAASPAPALAEADQAEVAPSIEPTPLATAALAQNNPAAATDPLTEPANLAVPGMEATTSTDAPAASTVVPTDDTASAVAAASSPSVETPVASTASPAAAQPVIANAPDTEGTDADETATTAAVAATPPGTLLAPAQVREWSQTTFAERLREGNTLLVAGLLLAAILLIGSVMIPQFVRLMKQSGSAGEAASSDSDFTSEESVAGLDQFVTPARLAGGPPQVSLHLRASEPALRRGAMPLSRAGRLGGGSGVETSTEGANSPAGDVVEDQPSTAIADDQVEEGVGEAVAVAAADEAMSTAPEAAVAPAAEETVSEQLEEVVSASFVPPVDIEAADQNADSTSNLSEELTTAEAADPAVEAAATERPATDIEQRPVVTMRDPEVATEEPAIVAAAEAEPEQAANVVEVAEVPPAVQTAPEVSMPVEMTPAPVASEPVVSEPVSQGQPVPYQSAVAAEAPTPEPAQPAAEPALEVPAAPVPPVLAGIGALRHSVASSAATPRITINEPTAQQPTTPATMPPPTTPTPAPVIRTEPPTAAPQQPAPAMQSAPQQGVAMHTAVQ